jgi:hypothetical protein
MRNAVKDNCTIQPELQIIGNLAQIDEIYVYFNQNKYKFDGVLEALNFTFHLYAVLNLKYPDHHSDFYMFIQKYFFDIDFEGLTIREPVRKLLTNLPSSN